MDGEYRAFGVLGQRRAAKPQLDGPSIDRSAIGCVVRIPLKPNFGAPQRLLPVASRVVNVAPEGRGNGGCQDSVEELASEANAKHALLVLF